MTISSTTRKAGPFPGNGVTVALPFTFKVFTAADVLAVQAVTATGVETTLTLGTDYTVSLNADQDTTPGGTLTLVTAHATGTTVTLTTQIENTQGTDLTNLGGFYPKVINDALDRATIQIQQLAEKLSRVLTFGISSGASGALPNPVALALLGWNAAGTALQNYAGVAGVAVSTFMTSVVSAVDAAAAQTALGASAIGRTLFTAASATAARAGIGAAASGANADITSLSGIGSVNGGQLAGLRNKIIDGKMDVAQRGASFAAAASGAYTLDRWVPSYSTSAAVTISQQADAPTNNEFLNSLRIAVTTADTTIAATDNFGIFQNIEGYNVRDLIGKTFTLSFWARSSKTGVHCASLRNTGNDRSYVVEYTINAVNTWEYKTITVTGGLPTAGTWNWTNGLGLSLGFSLASGSTFQTAAGAWQTGNFFATANQVNCLDTVGNIFAITGVQIEVGTVATPFEHRPYGLELQLCQRYFWIGGYGWAGSCINATNGTVSGTFPVQMRGAPTFAGINGAGGSSLIRSGGSAETITSYNNSGADKNGGWLYFGGSGFTTGSPYTVIKDLFTASAEL